MLDASAEPINEDLEDGEIFDDDEEDDIIPSATDKDTTTQPPVDQPVKEESPVSTKKRPFSPAGNDRRRPQRQRRTKRSREDDRSFPRKQRRRSEDHDKNREKDPFIGEDELLNVTRIRSPPPGARSNDWDRFNVRSDEEDNESVGSSRRNNRGRDSYQSRRRMRPRNPGRRGSNRRDANICKFFLQGKCQRGSECPFSHAYPSNRKFELCKFYMNDCCSKRDKCLFMHNDFPCKFFHLGLKCYAGKRCKFSHGKVSSYVKQQLIKHNQSESDKHFLHNLETTSPRESPVREPSREPSREHNNRGDSPANHQHRNNNNEQRHRNRRQENRNRHNNHQEEQQQQQQQQQRSVSPAQSDQDERYFDFTTPAMQTNEGSPYSDDERNRTPMPSPSQDNLSDRDLKSPEQELTCDYNSSNSETPPSDQKDSGLGEEMPQDVPFNLPRKQRELYLRIQQQQRHAQESENAEGEGMLKDDDFKDEDWYSSDDEGSTPLSSILNTIRDKKTESKKGLSVSEILPDFDVSAVSKLLTTVRETIQQKQQQQQQSCQEPQSNLLQSPSENKPQEMKRRVRDPRLRLVGSPPGGRRSPNDFSVTTSSLPPLPTPGDVDLRLATPAHTTSTSSSAAPLAVQTDVDLRQLPFKPVPVHQAANEIDASITSHPPVLNYSLIPCPPSAKPDYSQVQPKNSSDPRLRRFISQPLQPMSLSLPSIMSNNNNNTSGNVPSSSNTTTSSSSSTTTAVRDPRQRTMIQNDPRRRPLLPNPPGFPLGAPGLMMHHNSVHHRDSRDFDLRGSGGGQHPSYSNGNDVDLRCHQQASNYNFD